MPTTSRARVLAVTGAVLLLAILTAGCARRDQPAVGVPDQPTAPMAAEATPALPPSAPSASVPGPTATPVPAPDLSSIDALVKDIDNDLNADASAGTNEGSTP